MRWILYLITFCIVIGCSSVGQVTKSDKKFDLAEVHFKYVVMKPVEVVLFLIFLPPPAWKYAGDMERASQNPYKKPKKGDEDGFFKKRR